MFVNKHFTYLRRAYLRKQKVLNNVIPSVHYFYVKTKMLADFQICINVPLRLSFLFAEFGKGRFSI